MNITAEQIKENWDTFLGTIDAHISEPRKSQLLEFYKRHENRIGLMPASHKLQYHNCFAGGYIDHVLRVVTAALKIHETWKSLGAEQNYTIEELVFSAINHDLGKMGTETEPAYIPNSSQWHIDNKGELYEYNNKLAYMSVPDRSLYLLTQNGILYSENEYLAIKLHDGIYDEANKPYLTSFLPESKPRTSLVYIIHHADMLASRIEFEKEWFPKFKEEKIKKETKKLNKQDHINANLKKIAKGSDRLSKLIQEI